MMLNVVADIFMGEGRDTNISARKYTPERESKQPAFKGWSKARISCSWNTFAR